ncbi:MAG: hypothetical protein RL431_299 [Actinomycetota bacterium]|jgi:selenocysteine lyase/cysteine desulfurase
MSIDIDAVRAETPGIGRGTFLHSAGSSLPTQTTLDAVISHLRRESEIGGYAAAVEATDVLAAGRVDLAALVNGAPSEIALTTSDSAAWVKAWWGWVAGGNVPSGSTVLIDRLFYHSHYSALESTRKLVDFTIEVMPSLPDGTTDIFAVTIGDHISVVCATMIATHCGNVNPISELGLIACAAGVPLFVDACQGLGQLQLDVRELGCDVLTATGRKFLRAPRGTGMLWVSSDIVDRFVPPGLDATSTRWKLGGELDITSTTGRFEEFELPYAAMVGLAAAARQALEIGMPAIEERAAGLAADLRTSLGAVSGITVHETAVRRSAIVTFSVEGVAPSAVVNAAADAGITIGESTSDWSTLDMSAKGLHRVVRASPHYFNTESEVEHLVDTVELLVR